MGSITNSLYPEPAANCSSLVAGNSTEVIRIKKLLTRWKSPLTDEQFYAKLHDCTNLFSDYYYVSDTQRKFPNLGMHHICIPRFSDTPPNMAQATTHFFFNIYFMENDPVIMDCLERRILAQN